MLRRTSCRDNSSSQLVVWYSVSSFKASLIPHLLEVSSCGAANKSSTHTTARSCDTINSCSSPDHRSRQMNQMKRFLFASEGGSVRPTTRCR
jgi:hypothetical protein